jgi:hypothetical protein
MENSKSCCSLPISLHQRTGLASKSITHLFFPISSRKTRRMIEMIPDLYRNISWLPAPAGGGKLLYSIRFYSPADAFTNGEYVFPTVETIDAITA